MDEKKYQVFVSSTYVDLIHARKKIIETVLSLYHFPVGMEMFSADDSEQWDIIKETIDASDYYVIIIGHKYGSISPTGISYTEMEYDYAKSLNIPVLAFIRDRNALTKPDEREKDVANTERLELFIEKAKANKMCDFWDTIDDLATKVAIALPKVMRRTPRIGWVRGDQIASSEITAELAELSNENRRLREKVRAYESQLYEEAPELHLSIFDKELNLRLDSSYKAQDYFKPLSRSDIPLEYAEDISDDDIDEYNNSLPDVSAVDAYNKKYKLHKNFNDNKIKLSPAIENKGKRLASDVYVQVEIPDFLIFLTRENEGLFNLPNELKVKESPVAKRARMKNAQMTLAQIKRGLTKGFPFESDFIATHSSTPLNIIPKIEPILRDVWVEKSNHKIVLRTRKVLQSLSVEFDDVFLIPVRAGTGDINVKIICEELKEPVFLKNKVTVTSI